MKDWQEKKDECREITSDWVDEKCTKCYELIAEKEIKEICTDERLIKVIVSDYDGEPCCKDCLVDHMDQQATEQDELELTSLDEYETEFNDESGDEVIDKDFDEEEVSELDNGLDGSFKSFG